MGHVSRRILGCTFLDAYCSTVQGLLDWFEVDLGFTELLLIQIILCVLCVIVLYSRVSRRILGGTNYERALVTRQNRHAL